MVMQENLERIKLLNLNQHYATKKFLYQCLSVQQRFIKSKFRYKGNDSKVMIVITSLSQERFPRLLAAAARIIAMFGSTYIVGLRIFLIYEG